MEASLRLQRESLRQQRSSLRSQPAAGRHAAVAMHDFIEPIYFVTDSTCQPLSAIEAETLIADAAREQSLPPALIRAVIKQESGFKPCATSIKGAQGLMQLMPATAQEFHISDPFDPRQNVEAGAALLRKLLNKYNGDLRLTLGAYNAGANRVDNANGVPDLSETQSYVSQILRNLGVSPEQQNSEATSKEQTPQD